MIGSSFPATRSFNKKVLVNWCSKALFSNVVTNAVPKERLIVSCKRKQFDHYYGQTYKGLSEVPLATKGMYVVFDNLYISHLCLGISGWNRVASKGDHFVIFPSFDEYVEEARVKLDELDLNPTLIKCLKGQGFVEFTGFQQRAIEAIAEHRNAMLAAETGCGKTLAFLLPMLNEIAKFQYEECANTPRGLIVTPGRELAEQIEAVAKPLATAVGLKTKVTIGGHTKKLIMNPEFDNFDLLIATPGALGKLSNTGQFMCVLKV